MRIGQARLTAGLDRFSRIDLETHQEVFGGLRRVTAAQLIEMAERVDLRGRGGAAFPFARKLRAVTESARARKARCVVLVNGTEGEPGSAKDVTLLLRSPYLALGGALLACQALKAREIVVGVAAGPVAASVTAAIKAEPQLRRLARVVKVPERFVSGEGGALVNAVNGNTPLPPGRKRRASDSGVAGLPTLLSNAETFAQLAVLALLGPEGYASAGTAGEPGTVLLTVGGTAARPAVVEVPAGTPLGGVLDICQARADEGVLVGGYHGKWLAADIAYDVPVSRAGLEAAGGVLGAGVVLPLGAGTCPLGEVARIARYLAAESSGQCGPCKLGLPGVARALSSLADGSGGMEALDGARRAAAAVRGRGACSHPDGTSRFVLSALEVFTDDLAAHVFRGGCGRPVRGLLPVPSAAGEIRLEVDWTRCQGHGLCGRLVPELVRLDRQGYPVFLDTPVPFWLEREARHAVAMCPALALRLESQPQVAAATIPSLTLPPRAALS
jgi:NADH:ubiquinone oxidoreductase subunit F (NADH-binding)/ferredoxin